MSSHSLLTTLSAVALGIVSSKPIFNKPPGASTTTYSVSGLSSGAFFAVQYGVGFSSEVIGTGVVAGGPYYCAQDSIANALDACMDLPEEIDVSTLVTKTKEFANEGYIDDTSNIANQNIYLYSGTKDTVVKSEVVSKCETYYKDFNANTKYENDIASEHSMVTNFYGNECSKLGEPYINNCNYDLAGVILQFIYDNTLNQAMDNKEVPYNNVKQISQKTFVPSGKTASDISMQDIAYAYVASNCTIAPMSSNCKLHVVFHGCDQDLNSKMSDISGELFNDTYVRDAGYNGWAETNNFVILYPQADSDELKDNPNGCWDWWGYDGKDYAWQSGDQMSTCHNMVNYVLYGDTRKK